MYTCFMTPFSPSTSSRHRFRSGGGTPTKKKDCRKSSWFRSLFTLLARFPLACCYPVYCKPSLKMGEHRSKAEPKMVPLEMEMASPFCAFGHPSIFFSLMHILIFRRVCCLSSSYAMHRKLRVSCMHTLRSRCFLHSLCLIRFSLCFIFSFLFFMRFSRCLPVGSRA